MSSSKKSSSKKSAGGHGIGKGKGSSKGGDDTNCGPRGVDCTNRNIAGIGAQSFLSDGGACYSAVCVDEDTSTCGCPEGTRQLGGNCFALCDDVDDCNQDGITNEICQENSGVLACKCDSGYINCRDKARGNCITDAEFMDDSNCGCDGTDCLSMGMECNDDGECEIPSVSCTDNTPCNTGGGEECNIGDGECRCTSDHVDCRSGDLASCVLRTDFSDTRCGCDEIDCTTELEGGECSGSVECLCPGTLDAYSGVCRERCSQFTMLIACQENDHCYWDDTCGSQGPCFDVGETCPDDVGGQRYCRILSEFDETELFSLMEGDEWEEHTSIYEDKKDKQSSLGLCDYPGSKYRGLGGVTHQECFDPANQVVVQPATSVNTNANATKVKMHSDPNKEGGHFDPWAVPSNASIDGGGGLTLLAANPGIWSFDNFITEEEEIKLLNLINKYGYDLNMFGPCKHAKRHPVNAHPSRGKICFMISPTNVCEGPYDISDCATDTHSEDTAFIMYLLSKFKNMWSVNVEPYPYAKFQLSTGGTPPVDLHMDNEKSISFVLYLSDGGAKMIFPNANVTVTPKRRTAHTWLNMYEDGTRNPKSDHAVQAHPKDADERLVMLFEVPITPQKIIMASREDHDVKVAAEF